MNNTIKYPINCFCLILTLSTVLFWGCSCNSAKPVPNPLAGFHFSSLNNLHSNKVITDDYQDYIQKLPPTESKFVGPIGFSEDGTGRHAVSVEIFEANKNSSWQHVLIYDKENKRIKVIKYGHRKYQS